jgi:hypothetical protein
MAKQRVHHGEPPLTWLWDYYPLARDAWGNVLGFNDGSGDGHTIRMRMWLRAAPMSNFPPPAYRPAQAPLPPMFQDGGSRDCYIPTDADMALVKRLFGDVADAGNPPWPQIAARLIAAGQDRDKLATYNAPTLLLLLAEAEGMNAGGNGGTSARKPGKAKGGRPKVTDAEAEKRRELIAEWQRARDAGVRMKDFCKDRGCSVKYLEKCVNWASQRSRRDTTA